MSLTNKEYISINELDDFVEKANLIGSNSHSDRNTFLMTRSIPYSLDFPHDPWSVAYKVWVTAQWKKITGVDSYDVSYEQATNLSVESAALNPYPFSSKDIRFISEYNIGIFFLIKHLDNVPGVDVLEYGVGWGGTSLALMQSGFNVTAVDIDRQWLEIIQLRANQLKMQNQLTVYCAAFGDVPSKEQKFDAVVFYECFHHCLEQDSVLAKIVSQLNPNGLILFAGECIYPDYPIPWGVRQDGHAVWAIRSYKWMELGFSEDYFILFMRRHGLTLEKYTCSDAGAFGVLYKARLIPEGINYGRTQLTSQEKGFFSSEPSESIHTRFTDGSALLQLPSSDTKIACIELKNWLPIVLKCNLKTKAGFEWQEGVQPNCTVFIDVPLVSEGYICEIKIESEAFEPASLGVNNDKRKLGISVGFIMFKNI